MPRIRHAAAVVGGLSVRLSEVGHVAALTRWLTHYPAIATRSTIEMRSSSELARMPPLPPVAMLSTPAPTPPCRRAAARSAARRSMCCWTPPCSRTSLPALVVRRPAWAVAWKPSVAQALLGGADWRLTAPNRYRYGYRQLGRQRMVSGGSAANGPRLRGRRGCSPNGRGKANGLRKTALPGVQEQSRQLVRK